MPADQLTSKWLRAEEIVRHVQLGDLLEFDRESNIAGVKAYYAHWAVYVGRHENSHFVIHVSGGERDFGRRGSSGFSSSSNGPAKADKAKVRRDPLMAVAGKDLVRINNTLDAHYQPFPPEIVVERATRELGPLNYNVLSNNCEHFATWCRYGRGKSAQGGLATTTLVHLGALALLNPLLALHAVAMLVPWLARH